MYGHLRWLIALTDPDTERPTLLHTTPTKREAHQWADEYRDGHDVVSVMSRSEAAQRGHGNLLTAVPLYPSQGAPHRRMNDDVHDFALSTYKELLGYDGARPQQSKLVEFAQGYWALPDDQRFDAITVLLHFGLPAPVIATMFGTSRERVRRIAKGVYLEVVK